MRPVITGLILNIFCITLLLGSVVVQAQNTTEKPSVCEAADIVCLLTLLKDTTEDIEEPRWKDQTYRELAKLLTKNKNVDSAIELIALIGNPDTKAMTIRGIGMAAAETDMTQEQYNELFEKLRDEAEDIEHAPSYAIALTYIAMAQAFAGDDDGAMRTAADMKNDALRNKAYGESAEIQAERGDIQAAMTSIAAIESDAFRNKAYRTISKIFADRNQFDNAIESSMAIDNSYQRSQALLYLIARQLSPQEVTVVTND